MTSSASDIYQLAQATITRQQTEIDSLRQILGSESSARSVGLKISPELKVLFPQIKDIAVVSPVFAGIESEELDTVNVALVSYSSRLNASQREKFEEYLKARLGIRQISIVEVSPSVTKL